MAQNSTRPATSQCGNEPVHGTEVPSTEDPHALATTPWLASACDKIEVQNEDSGEALRGNVALRGSVNEDKEREKNEADKESGSARAPLNASMGPLELLTADVFPLSA